MQLSNSLTPRSIASSNYLLRKYGGAAAAYSLQRLDTSVDNVVRVRRSTDDTEADFTAQEVSGGSLREFALNNDADLIRFADQATAADKRMYFDGAGDHIRAAGIDAGETGDFTATCYFTPSSFGSLEQILSNSNTIGSIAFELRLSSTPVLNAGITIGGSFKPVTGATTLSVGTIYRVGIRRASDQLEVWLDGVKDGSATYVGARDPQSLFCVGCRNNNQLFANGLIYDVKYWDSAISEAEMLVDGTGGVPATSPTSYLRGYGNTDADWEDQVGSNDGTVNGSPALFSGQGFDAYVTTLYDQSGNGRNATQATAASQPQIVASGVVVTDSNGNAAMDFDGTDDHMSSGLFTAIPQPFTGLCVSQFDSANNNQDSAAMGGGASNQFLLSFQQNNYTPDEWQAYAGTLVQTGVSSDNNLNLHSALISGASSEYWLNGSSVAQANFGANSITAVAVGCATAIPSLNGPWFGLVHEVILYPSDITANRASIETNIASRYGIVI
jgi:hypothetical protein